MENSEVDGTLAQNGSGYTANFVTVRLNQGEIFDASLTVSDTYPTPIVTRSAVGDASISVLGPGLVLPSQKASSSAADLVFRAPQSDTYTVILGTDQTEPGLA